MTMRERYEELIFWENELKNCHDVRTMAFCEKQIKKEKKRIRELNKDEEKGNRYEGYIIVNEGYDDDGDGFWEKRLYPGAYADKEDKEEFIRNNWRYVNSPYDCSGQIFTWRIEVCNVPNGVVVYMFYAIDI